jgi:glycogen operon protein
MNSYWEPLTLQLPELTNGMEWKIVVNTYCQYQDGLDFSEMTENFGYNTFRVPPRSTLIFVAE